MTAARFSGFPGLASATAIPNVFFSTVLPEISDVAELLAFMWVQRITQAQTGEVRFTTENELWAKDPVRRSFGRLSGGKEGLRRGLEAAFERGTLLSLVLVSRKGREPIYFVNNPGSRRSITRARAGDLAIRPGAAVVEQPAKEKPNIYALYEEHVGTITPMVGERLAAAEERYAWSDIEAAFREAAELNVRNWRYIERVLERWEREGRFDGAYRGDSLEERKRRFLAPDRSHFTQ
ncbi:MAG: DnaD domain-containing protein [Dehalococcoidia bacterium]